MPDDPLKMKRLRKIPKRYDVWENPSRGKGSHTMFFREIEESTFSYPIPIKKDVKRAYGNGVRRKFLLTEDDGVSDDEFYGD